MTTPTPTIHYAVDDGIATLTMDEPNSPVNTMCEQWQKDLIACTARVVAERQTLRGIILDSAKKVFFAGADLKAVMRSSATDAVAVYEEVETIKGCFRRLETLGIPVVSCINGHALGGGCELALVGHHRLAVDNDRIALGLPEVTLGLIPGATGISKMVRLLGLKKAQAYLVEGKTFTPTVAHAMGLVHALVPDGDGARQSLRDGAMAWIDAHPSSQQPWDVAGYEIPGGGANAPQHAGLLSVAPAMLMKKTRGLLPAPAYALACMVEGSIVDYDTATRIESRYLARLWTTPVARNLISHFFNMNAIKSGQSRPNDVPRARLSKVGVLGAGMMGSGIAYAQAASGIQTVLKDVTIAQAEKGKAYSAQLTQTQVTRGHLGAEAQAALLARIQATDDMADLAGCELIVEAVFEARDLKTRVISEAEPQLAAGGFFASNTSTLPISGLSQGCQSPERFIGIHFFSPVDKMKLVEIIRGEQTSEETLARAFDYVQQIGKIPIVVNDARGFYTSRTFGTFVMEGAAMVGEGIPAAVIENAAMQCGMPVGPLAVLDETALSLSVQVLDQTRKDLAERGEVYQPSAGERLVERMVKELDRPGRAGGGGFYAYPEGEKKHLWPELATLFERAEVAWSVSDIQDRLLYRQAIETARCLHEGVLGTVHDANIGSIYGIGFPMWTGGAMQFIYGTGIAAFERRASELANKYGAGFALSDAVKVSIRKNEPQYEH